MVKGFVHMESLEGEIDQIEESFSSSINHLLPTSNIKSIEDYVDDNLKLQWATIERLPSNRRMRSSLFGYGNGEENNERRVVDVSKLNDKERQIFIDRLIRNIEHDNRQLLENLIKRIKRVDLKLPTMEVRYKALTVDARCKVHAGIMMPNLWNSIKGFLKQFINAFEAKSKVEDINIIENVSGIIKPSRMTLLLGPPNCGKTTLLLALVGQASKLLKVNGEITYNGWKKEEFDLTKAAAYISQNDQHVPEMTVRETLDFSARCQGVGCRADIMLEVGRREKQAQIIPNPDIDTYMKAIAVKCLQQSLQTNYILKILGLETCSETIIGDAVRRGISGGQKRRLTTGEMMVGPSRAFFMDEISNGLDSSTTFQIISCIQQFVHITEATALISLLQPTPETFNLFDDIIIMSKGKIIYHGPRDQILSFFEDCGFRCPQRKGIADFLQEVISKKDQAQYWYIEDKSYKYITTDEFVKAFQGSTIGKKLEEELSKPYDKEISNENAFVFSTHSITKWEMLRTCMDREFLLLKRNSYVFLFKSIQISIVAIITMSTFLQTKKDVDLQQSSYYAGSLKFAIIRLMTNGIAELTLSLSRLAVFYKQRDLHFYPAWAYSVPAALLKLPISLVESFLWTAITYYGIGYSHETERFLCHFLILFGLHQASTSLFRLLASVTRTPHMAALSGNLSLLVAFMFSGFILPHYSFPVWLRWAFWFSPATYAQIGLSINEFQAPKWKRPTSENMTLGHQILKKEGVDFKSYFYWLSAGALFGFTFLFNIGITLSFAYMNNPGASKSAVSSKKLIALRQAEKPNIDGQSESNSAEELNNYISFRKGIETLAFQPLTMTFKDIQYFIETPKVRNEQGNMLKKLQLIQNMTGAFRPGILTALMGISGAGKTTLMDVLCGRKTLGTIGGEIRIGGYPKVQETFTRISAYCEQNDIHSPHITVEESVMYSAWLRLPQQISPQTKEEFVQIVLKTIELDNIKDSLVGMPDINGISKEQRKRLTIAVELVANPSIIFLDEPTTGLDARAAAIVIRAVRSIAETGRTVVCTIHQPSIDMFESFDELLLMKKGGQLIYSGQLGQNSRKLIEYFENIPGIPKIKDNYNPATWMLEITSAAMELRLGIDFADIYTKSPLYEYNKNLVEQLSIPSSIFSLNDLQFQKNYHHSRLDQFKACIWKLSLSYWRSPTYNLVRLTMTTVLSLLFAAIFWQKGNKINNEHDLFSIMGSMYISTIFLGISNCSTVLPMIARERLVLYRERSAGMYPSYIYALAQVIIEIPCSFILALTYTIITFPTTGYYWSTEKLMLYFHIMFCTLLYYNYLGMMIMSLSPNVQMAAVLASAFYAILNLFAGFLIPKVHIPQWWIWLYLACPTSWTLNGLLTSQYGDVAKEIVAFGETKTLDAFLKDYYGFQYSKLGFVGSVIVGYPFLFALIFMYSMAKLNFQKR